ncbi:hypothetical protein [Seonamhaeicola marinus]|uniref:Uncharacterized protein n=1 Tax=Seonamhaeicola marinus TaxID=1912246 RepID=A0A5D0I4L6_9FLAO|nr:hypothetical protein [Seonamhaeicola marinus]TYA78614.1 hypothetical protein FUA24_09690 [Seonamhaeicola marinus]
MRIKAVFKALFGNKKTINKEPQVFLENGKIKFHKVKVYTGVFDIIEEINMQEIEQILICSEYDRGNSEASLFVKISSREQVIDIDNYMIGFDVLVEEIFKIFEIDNSFHRYYKGNKRLQYVYPLKRQGVEVKRNDFKFRN